MERGGGHGREERLVASPAQPNHHFRLVSNAPNLFLCSTLPSLQTSILVGMAGVPQAATDSRMSRNAASERVERVVVPPKFVEAANASCEFKARLASAPNSFSVSITMNLKVVPWPPGSPPGPTD